MCGFAGFFSTAGYSSERLVDHVGRMVAPLAHRGPDDSGVWSNAEAGIALGFRRLAVIDLSPDGHQPMQSSSGRFVMVFNGEIYNFKELRRELEPHGYPFKGRSDTEVMLAGFERWGIREAIGRLIGMFAVAVWDTERRELSLCRDRVGKKPLYLYSEPGLLSFGSELKALVAGPSFDKTIDRNALALYLRYLYVPAPLTIFARATKLPAAHILTLRDPGRALPLAEPYWSLRDAALRGLADPIDSADHAVDELDRLLQDSVQRRLHADVPIGALLSGGIDSSVIVALMQEASTRPVKTYTIGFAEAAFNEAQHAADVARHLGTNHTELLVTADDARALVPQMPQVFDEPFANPSQLPMMLICQLARRDVTVALCGDGGDELFAGYNRYRTGAQLLKYASVVPAPIRRSMSAAMNCLPMSTIDRVHHWAAGGSHQHSAHDRLRKVTAMLNADGVGTMYRSLMSAAWQEPNDLTAGLADVDDSTRSIMDGDEPTALLDRMMLADQTVYLPDDSLAKVDRASMAVNLEVRAPLLDHRVVELSWRLPHVLKMRRGVGKWALRQVLYRRVPKDMVERSKMGLTVPIDQWLRGPLRDWADDLLPDARSGRDEFLDGPTVARAWSDLREGKGSSGLAVWAVVMFQAWKARWAA